MTCLKKNDTHNKKVSMNKIIIYSLFLLTPILANAENNYFCTIKAASEVGNNGRIKEAYKKPYKDQTFSVSKVSGVMKGFLQNTLGGNPQIIQLVSPNYSFKVFTKSILFISPTIHYHYIRKN